MSDDNVDDDDNGEEKKTIKKQTIFVHLFFDTFRNFPPSYIHTSSGESQIEDGREMSKKLKLFALIKSSLSHYSPTHYHSHIVYKSNGEIDVSLTHIGFDDNDTERCEMSRVETK